MNEEKYYISSKTGQIVVFADGAFDDMSITNIEKNSVQEAIIYEAEEFKNFPLKQFPKLKNIIVGSRIFSLEVLDGCKNLENIVFSCEDIQIIGDLSKSTADSIKNIDFWRHLLRYRPDLYEIVPSKWLKDEVGQNHILFAIRKGSENRLLKCSDIEFEKQLEIENSYLERVLKRITEVQKMSTATQMGE